MHSRLVQPMSITVNAWKLLTTVKVKSEGGLKHCVFMYISYCLSKMSDIRVKNEHSHPKIFMVFLTISRKIPKWYHKLGNSLFFQNTLQFIPHQPNDWMCYTINQQQINHLYVNDCFIGRLSDCLQINLNFPDGISSLPDGGAITP